MAGFVSVERVDITLANGTETVTTNLTKSQDEAKCVPFSSSQRVLVSGTGQSDFQAYNHAEIEIIDNAGTPAVRASVGAMAASNSLAVSVYVVEFGDDITVVQGTFDIVASSTTDVISITAVDETKAFLLFEYNVNTSDADGIDEAMVRGAFSTSSELTFTRGLGPSGSTVNGTYYIVEDTASNWDVQSGTHNVTTTGSSTITSIDTAKTFIIASHSQTHTVDDIRYQPTTTLGSATTVTSARLTSIGTTPVEWFAVTFDSGGAENVYRGSISGTAATGTASHTSVDPLLTSVHTPQRHTTGRADAGGTASSDFNQALVKYVLNATDDGVDMARSVAQGGSQSIQSWWETIEWEEGGGAPALSGNSAISQASTVVSTGTGAKAGDSAVSQASTVVPTGTKAATASSSVSQASTVVASGTPLETRSGSASISQASTVAASGTPIEVRSGSSAVSQASTLVASGVKNASVAGTIVQASTVVSSGTPFEVRSGSSSVAQGSSLSGLGTKATGADVSISQGSSVAASGSPTVAKSGSSTVSQGSSVVGSGTKGAEVSVPISQASTVVSTGTRVDGGNDKHGSPTISQASTVVAPGTKDVSGPSVVSQASSVVVAATALDPRSGSSSLSVGSSSLSIGTKGASADVSVSQGSSVAAQGIAGVSDSAVVNQASTIAATGLKRASGASNVSQGSTVVASGTLSVPVPDIHGSPVIQQASTTSASGTKSAGGPALIEQFTGIVSPWDRKQAFADVTVSQGSSLVASGGQRLSGDATATASTSASASGTKGALVGVTISAVTDQSSVGDKQSSGSAAVANSHSVSSSGGKRPRRDGFGLSLRGYHRTDPIAASFGRRRS
jgi:hypothetical protein